MRPATREWVEKAEGDYCSAGREYRARKNPNYDSACFHAQQCAEKYLKACLQEKGIAIPKTHDLVKLLDLLVSAPLTLVTLRAGMALLSSYAVEFRYPGESASRDTAKEAQLISRVTRKEARVFLSLPAIAD